MVRSAAEVDFPPFSMADDSGEATGFAVELLTATLQTMGREVTFQTGIWSDVRGWLERGEVDVLPLVGRTPEREPLFDFSIPYLTMHGAIVVRESTQGITTLDDLQGKTVAVMKGDNAEEFLRRQERDFTIRTTDTFATALSELAAGRHDAVFIQRLTALRLIEQLELSTLHIVNRPVEEFQQDFCFAVPEGERELLALLNEGLAVLMADGTYRYLHAKWFAALELPVDRPIIVGGDEDFPPFEYLNANGEPDGFNVALTKAIAHEMGMNVEIRLGPWPEIRQAFERGEIDVIQGMLYTPERDLELDFAPAHAMNNYVAVVRKQDAPPPSTVDELEGLDIVVQEDDLTQEFAVQHGFGNQLTIVPSQEIALQRLVDGEFDCALVSSVTAYDWIHYYNWDELEVAAKPLITAEYCYAVANGAEPLLAQFTSGLNTLQASGDFRRIYEEWLGVFETSSPNVRDILRFSATVLVPLLLVLLLAIGWSWSLRQRVAARTEELRRSEELQRAIIACSPVAIYSVDTTGTVQLWNASAERIFGWTAEEIVGRPLPIVPDDRREEHTAFRKAALQGEAFVTVEVERLRKDGTRFDGSLSVAPIRDASGNIVGIMGAMLDISERKRAEEALRRSEEQFRTLVEGAPDAIAIHVNARFVYVNQACVRMLGATAPDEVIGRPVLERIHPDERAEVAKSLRSLADGDDRLEPTVETVVSLQGEAIPVEIAAVPFMMGGSNGALVFARDVRARLEAERKLEESERRFRRAVEDAPYPIVIHAETGELLTLSRAWTEISGYSLDEIGTIDNWLRLAHADRAEDVRRAIQASYDLSASRRGGEFDVMCSDGTHRTWDFSSTPLGTLPDGRRVVISMAADVTERKRAEARVEHLNRVLRAIRDVNQLIVRERDRDTLIRDGCQTLVDNRGYVYAVVILADEFDGPVGWAEAGTNAPPASLSEMLERGELPGWCRHVPESGTIALLDESAAATVGDGSHGQHVLCVRLIHDHTNFGYLAVVVEHGQNVDAEDRALFAELADDLAYALHVMAMDRARESIEQQHRSLQSQMIQAQKMESVGRLAGGVAHDFNNFLGVIVGYAELALDKVPQDGPLHDDLVEILKAANRSTEVTRQLLAFARKQTIRPKILDLNETVEGMLKMLRRLIGEDIELAWLPDPVAWQIKMDPAQIDQIVANLCVNARDAIAGVGKIVLETHNCVIDDADCIERTDMHPGSYVVLTVSDNGCGMDKATMASIFEPFFTTKGPHQGTGLGLATVYGIVQQNNGFINVYSESEKGTSFKAYLPRFEGKAPEARAGYVALPQSKGETILLVEDEPAIMKMGSMMLEKLGYMVVTTPTPHEALEFARGHAGEIDLLITDVVMPEMNGRDLAQTLQETDPRIKTLFMSGYTADVIAHRGILEEGVMFIAKPFTLSDLAVKVRATLESISTD